MLKQNSTWHDIKITNDAEQINRNFIYLHIHTWCIKNFQDLIVQIIWNHTSFQFKTPIPIQKEQHDKSKTKRPNVFKCYLTIERN